MRDGSSIGRASAATGLACLALIGGFGCQESFPARPLYCDHTDLDLSVTVAEGSPPRFSWRPRCTAWSLVVAERLESGLSARWSITAGASGDLRSPITYGVVPQGASVSMPAEPLTRGVEHRLLVQPYRPGTRETQLQVGVSFTP